MPMVRRPRRERCPPESQLVYPGEQVAFGGRRHRRQELIDAHARDVPGRVARSAECVFATALVQESDAREAAKRRMPGIADRRFADGVPEHEEAAVRDRISKKQTDPFSPVQRWSSWMVRIEGMLGTGDSLALAVQPASPCREPQAKREPERPERATTSAHAARVHEMSRDGHASDFVIPPSKEEGGRRPPSLTPSAQSSPSDGLSRIRERVNRVIGVSPAKKWRKSSAEFVT